MERLRREWAENPRLVASRGVFADREDAAGDIEGQERKPDTISGVSLEDEVFKNRRDKNRFFNLFRDKLNDF